MLEYQQEVIDSNPENPDHERVKRDNFSNQNFLELLRLSFSTTLIQEELDK